MILLFISYWHLFSSRPLTFALVLSSWGLTKVKPWGSLVINLFLVCFLLEIVTSQTLFAPHNDKTRQPHTHNPLDNSRACHPEAKLVLPWRSLSPHPRLTPHLPPKINGRRLYSVLFYMRLSRRKRCLLLGVTNKDERTTATHVIKPQSLQPKNTHNENTLLLILRPNTTSKRPRMHYSLI